MMVPSTYEAEAKRIRSSRSALTIQHGTTQDYLRKKSEWLHVNTSANVKPLASRLLRTTSVCKGPWIRAAQLCSDLHHWNPAGFCWWGGRCQEWSL